MPRVPRWEWIALALILAVGLGLRLLYLREAVDKPDFAAPAVDAGFHDYWARGLAFGDWRPPFDFPDPLIRETAYLRPPGYPYFLSLIYTVCGPGYTAPRVVQMGLGLVSAGVAWLFARRWFGRGIALVLAGFMATYWAFIYFEGEFHAPALVIYLTWLTVYLAGLWAEKLESRFALLAGVLVGVTALVLPNALVYLPVLIGWAWWVARRHGARFAPAALRMAVGCALAIAPATIRNYLVARDFVLISNNAGINLFIGNNASATGLVADRIAGVGDFKTCFDYPALVASLQHQLGPAERGLKPSEVSAHFRDEALRFICENPARFVALTAKKALLFWGPREVLHNKVIRYERESSPVLRSIPLTFSVVAVLALLGIPTALHNRRIDRANLPLSPSPTLPLLLLAVTGAYFLSVLPFFAAARYRVPVIPFLLFFAASALCHWGAMLKRGQMLRATLAVAAASVVFALHTLAARIVPEGPFERAKWHYDRAVAYALTGRPQPAAAEYTQVIERMPQNPHARLGLGLSLAKLGRAAEAADQFREAVTLLPEYPEAHFNLAVALESQGRIEEAMTHYAAAVEHDPAFAPGYYNLGVLLAASGRADDAMAQYAAAIRARPDFTPAHTNLAIALLERGRLADAEAHFRAVVQLHPQDPQARCNLALGLAAMGRTREAAAEYQAALELDPMHAEARAALAELMNRSPASRPASQNG